MCLSLEMEILSLHFCNARLVFVRALARDILECIRKGMVAQYQSLITSTVLRVLSHYYRYKWNNPGQVDSRPH